MKETIADRIKLSRLNQGLSQSELAKKAGYNDKTAISKFEHAGDDISIKQIKRVAKALNVSAAFLMGWEEIEAFSSPAEFEVAWFERGGGKHPITLSDEEHALILTYRNSDDTTKEMLNRILKYKELLEKRLNHANS